MAKPWGQAEDARLAQLRGDGLAAHQIAGLLGRSCVAVIKRMKGGMRPEIWGRTDVDFLKKLRGDGKTAAQIAALMGRTRNAVMGRVARLQKNGALPPAGKRCRGPQAKPHKHDGAITHMARDGMSVAEIAKRLVMDESAVRYRVKKLGLKIGRADTTCLSIRVAGRKETAVAAKDEARSGYQVFHGTGVSLLTASESACRWPLDGKAPDGQPQCCGDAKLTGFSYCRRHALLAMPKMFAGEEAAA